VACHDHIFKKNVRRAAATESQANRTRLVMKRDGIGGIGGGEEGRHNGSGSFHGCGLNDRITERATMVFARCLMVLIRLFLLALYPLPLHL
jgi:hypothetical protein